MSSTKKLADRSKMSLTSGKEVESKMASSGQGNGRVHDLLSLLVSTMNSPGLDRPVKGELGRISEKTKPFDSKRVPSPFQISRKKNTLKKRWGLPAASD